MGLDVESQALPETIGGGQIILDRGPEPLRTAALTERLILEVVRMYSHSMPGLPFSEIATSLPPFRFIGAQQLFEDKFLNCSGQALFYAPTTEGVIDGEI